MKNSLTPTQGKALNKLTSEWKSNLDLKEKTNTLLSLVHHGFAERKFVIGQNKSLVAKYRSTLFLRDYEPKQITR